MRSPQRATGPRELLHSATARFSIPLAGTGSTQVSVRHPVTGAVVGEWGFERGGDTLTVDLLDPAVCNVNGAGATMVRIEEGFIPWPRLRLDVGDSKYELISADAEVLRRHYSRPRHQESSYANPDRWSIAFHEARVRQVRRLLAGIRGRVLDAGSGYSLVATAGPWDFELHACDHDPGAVTLLNEQRRAIAVVAPAEETPYAAGTFDAVYAGEVIEHLVYRPAALAHWASLLRPGGRLVITTPNRRHLLTRLRGFELVENPEHLHEYECRELCLEIARAGVAITHVEGLILQLPVYVPGRGWRDIVPAIARRMPVPQTALSATVEAGRRFPALAQNLAVVAHKRV